MADISPLEAGKAVLAAVQAKLDSLSADIARLQKAEAMGKSLHGLPPTTPSAAQMADGNPDKSKLTKTVFQVMKKGETFIDLKHSADPKKRDKDVGFEGVMPSDRKEKEVSADGSGGNVKKAGMDMGAKPPVAVKPPQSPAAAPQGAAAGQPPKAPKAPGAAMKKEVGVFSRLQKKVK